MYHKGSVKSITSGRFMLVFNGPQKPVPSLSQKLERYWASP